jgi:Mg-chelatase subunit ChlD
MSAPFASAARVLLCTVSVALAAEARAQDPTAPSPAAAETVVIELDAPASTPLGESGQLGFVSGRAFAVADPAQQGLDVVFALDVSGSTRVFAGRDLNGDGRIDAARELYQDAIRDALPETPFFSDFFANLGTFIDGYVLAYDDLAGRDQHLWDSALHAETQGVDAAMLRLDPRIAHVGVVTFARREDGGEVARLRAPLTDDYGQIRTQLFEVLRESGEGPTDLAAVVRLITKTLAVSTRRTTARPVAVLLSDGFPRLPSEDVAANEDEAIRAAELAASYGICIHTVGFGPEVAVTPRSLREIARATGGTHQVVETPADLPRTLESLRFAGVRELAIRNATLDAPAVRTTENPDGSFGALVPMREGVNEIVVEARGAGGVEMRQSVLVSFDPAAPLTELPARQQRDRRTLLERASEPRDGVAAPAR